MQFMQDKCITTKAYTKEGSPVTISYTVCNIVGKGTFGIVYRIILNNVFYALKTTNLDPRYQNRELSTLQQLEHPNIVPFYYFYILKNKLYLIFQLKKEIKHINSTDLLKKYFFDILHALKYLKSKRIIHRDIKPRNILVDNDRAYLCDFGSAKEVSYGSITYICSRSFRAPELILDLDYDCAIDVWSLGVSFYEIFMNRRLFSGNNNSEILNDIENVLQVKGGKESFLEVKKRLLECTDDEVLIRMFERSIVYDKSKRATPEELLDLEIK